MAKLGRPYTYQSEEEKPVTVSLRLPRDLYRQVERYVKRHPGMTLTEFFLDGARLRLDTPADPRDIISYNDNTIIQEETPQRSPRRGGLKLTPQQEAALRAKRKQGTPVKELMKEYGISRATVFRYLE
jgi:hypothetical protein